MPRRLVKKSGALTPFLKFARAIFQRRILLVGLKNPSLEKRLSMKLVKSFLKNRLGRLTHVLPGDVS
jgi:hypothetical protein